MQHHLSTDVRSDVRFFAFYVGNGVLLELLTEDDDLEYRPLLQRRDDVVGQLFAVFLNVLPADQTGNSLPRQGTDPDRRASQWLRHLYDPRYRIEPPLEPWEVALDTSEWPWTQAIKDFARVLGRGSLAPDLLEGIDYIDNFFEDGAGSWLEKVFAIFTNVLLIDEDGHPLNAAWAARRAAMYIRSFNDPAFGADPPWASWEGELW